MVFVLTGGLENYSRKEAEEIIESFGGKEYMISAIPANLFHVDMKDLFIEMLDDFSNLSGKELQEAIKNRKTKVGLVERRNILKRVMGRIRAIIDTFNWD